MFDNQSQMSRPLKYGGREKLWLHRSLGYPGLSGLFILLLLSGVCRADVIKEDDAVRAIVGEAANQGIDGMTALASAIRNRGHLRGVYGLKNPIADKQPKWVWDQAREAWRRSAVKDYANGADHWENVKAFGMPKWAKNMKIVLVVKDHTFFRNDR